METEFEQDIQRDIQEMRESIEEDCDLLKGGMLVGDEIFLIPFKVISKHAFKAASLPQMVKKRREAF